MPNRLGQGYALTVLSPIVSGHTNGVAHATEIRAALDRLGPAAASPFAGVDSLHFARFAVIDDLRQQGMPAKEDHLQSKYLLFVADFFGDLAPFLGSLLATAPDMVQAIWSHCVGFPGTANAGDFQRYIERCQVTSTFPFGAYPTTSLDGVLRALDTQRRFIQFLKSTQGMAALEQQTAFQSFARELAAAPLPLPGTI